MNINAQGMDFQTLNQSIKNYGSCKVCDCCGQRFLAAGMSDIKVELCGTPGNALGAYLNGAEIIVRGNAQDSVGDTMNSGKIIIYGNVGDAPGLAMRGGEMFVRGDAGYRAGIHMKEYRQKKPVMVIGGKCGSFLGEYQAGGTIIVLGLTVSERNIVGNFPSTGMHGGKIFLRSDCKNIRFPEQVTAKKASGKDIDEIRDYINKFCEYFDYDQNEILNSHFTLVTPNSNNPYKQMYVTN